jgi:glyoxylase-like metal-dependent hydrolase (beta-lactamase superfamily II)
VQQVRITVRLALFCFQLPCGGNVFALKSPDEVVLIDTGYGIYHKDVCAMLERYGIGRPSDVSRVIVTHADADHCGACGHFLAPAFMHPTTLEIIRTNNRAYGSRSEGSILEAFYTQMINLFSGFTVPENVVLFPREATGMRGIFPVIGTVTIDGIRLDVLESLGGHMVGQVYLFSEEHGLLFAADSVINFASLTPERAAYNSLADFLVTSVNVDSELAKKERKALFDLVAATDEALKESGKRCIVCGGHGAVSVYDSGKLVTFGNVEHYGAVGPVK